jgi:O-antigen ligase
MWRAAADMAVDAGTFALCCFAATAFGSNEPWAMGLIAAASGVLLACRLIPMIWSGERPATPWSAYPPLLLFCAFAGAQALFWRRGLPEAGLWSIHTVERHSTVLYLMLAVSYAAAAFLVQNGFGSRRRLRLLWLGVIALGAFEAVYGLVQYMGDYDFIWHFEKASYRGMATGTFVNRNHYALFMNLALCAGAGFLFYRAKRMQGPGDLSLRGVVKHPDSAKLLWFGIVLALMGLAVVFSTSRMGIAAMLGASGAMLVAVRSLEAGRRGVLAGLLVLAAIVGLALYMGLEPVIERFQSIEMSMDYDRMPLWRDAWPMAARHFLFGQGLGSFQWTYPAYETVAPDIPARYAHNDYLQAVAETGVAGLALLLWAAAALWRTALRNLRSASPFVGGIGLASIGAMTAIAMQEITDFGLYIPGVAVMAAVLAGLNLRAAGEAPPR